MVVKFGGNAMVDQALLESFAEDIVYLHHAGICPVVVHGGGPQISALLKRLQLKSEFRGGYRVTTPEIMDAVRMVLTGKVNPQLVDAINVHGPLAVGISGQDAGLFRARRRQPIEVDGGEKVDLGLVGDIVSVRPDAVLTMIERGFIPVVSSIAPDESTPPQGVDHFAEPQELGVQSGQALNVNADAAAAALAIALQAEKLVILTDVPGVYAHWPETSTIISSMNVSELDSLLPEMATGMIPKLKACSDAVRGGVKKAAVIDGREPHSVLLEIFTSAGIGTEIVPDIEPEPVTQSIPVLGQ